jgi:hypothetical protein
LAASVAEMKASIGVRAHPACVIAGVAGAFTGCQDQGSRDVAPARAGASTPDSAAMIVVADTLINKTRHALLIDFVIACPRFAPL